MYAKTFHLELPNNILGINFHNDTYGFCSDEDTDDYNIKDSKEKELELKLDMMKLRKKEQKQKKKSLFDAVKKIGTMSSIF